MYQLPQNIKKIRKAWREHQDVFAARFDRNRMNVSNYERGENTPDIFFLIKLQDLTGINAKVLCYENLNLSDIPKVPLSQPYTSDFVEEPKVSYREADLYNYHHLVSKVKELEKLVLELSELLNSK